MKAKQFLLLLIVLIFSGCQTLTISTGSIKRTITGRVRDGIVIYNNSTFPCRLFSYEFDMVITTLDDPTKLICDTIPAYNAVRVGIPEWLFENDAPSHREIMVVPLVKRADGLRMETKKIRWDTRGHYDGRQDGKDHRVYTIEDERSRSGALIGIKIK